jgi:acetyl-CoA C-acetyltransferase
MTNAPYLLAKARGGYRMGNDTLIDAMIHDGLWCAFEMERMGEGTQRYADEIVEVRIPQRKGDLLVVDTDEGVRPGTTAESLAGLRPAFVPDGTITAGNASQISDGAAAVVLMSRAAAERFGVDPLAEVVGYGMVAGPDPSLLHQPSRAIRRALERAGRSLADVDLFEINEAFAAVGASARWRSAGAAARATRSGQDPLRPAGRHRGPHCDQVSMQVRRTLWCGRVT